LQLDLWQAGIRSKHPSYVPPAWIRLAVVAA
jgi:hypothetical protein